MEAAKILAANILTNEGFRVEEIPVGDGRSADLRVTDNESIYHIEIKEKFEAESLATERTERLKGGEMYPQSDPLSRNNRIKGILCDARDQLNETPKEDGTFQLIWFHASGIDYDLKYRQAFATFYGDVPVSARDTLAKETAHCFYFDYAACFDMPTVEALILSDKTQLQICLNEFAIREREFRASQFFERFFDRSGIFDPVALMATGEIVPCRAKMPRKNENEQELIKALQLQTGILYSTIRLNRYTYSLTFGPFADRARPGEH